VGGTFSGGGNNLRADIQWGDGTTTAGTIDRSTSSYRGVHQYSTGGIFQVIVTLRDDDGGVATEKIETVVSGVRLTDDGTLQIVGSSGDDRFSVKKQGSRIRVDMRLDGHRWERFQFKKNAVDAILVFACDGHDRINIDGRLGHPA